MRKKSISWQIGKAIFDVITYVERKHLENIGNVSKSRSHCLHGFQMEKQNQNYKYLIEFHFHDCYRI